mmetsp:Transcript_23849/g.28813  ORF Transcript_23849/g.28813 Transcript_23849/m.28813 type:complete len:437 (+) Transcript_23849:158-1468(+)|eukprot:CAMPEP_0197846578 /NCGR_PEP_ID=MMETSP1438-20131217/3690_1 /TAXON_ID=1461541 /ORGANISM="Pterosperma sp., Strain CCMP1384" /LENGTH=436 /DNA_ID=CAMNT_0043458279 /DNA_START=153 /DNA_END=1463 /DNA_ORIENTATION=+
MIQTASFGSLAPVRQHTKAARGQNIACNASWISVRPTNNAKGSTRRTFLKEVRQSSRALFATRRAPASSRSRGLYRISAEENKNLAPLQPESPAGEFLNYIINEEPQLFQSAVEEQLTRLSDEAEEYKKISDKEAGQTDSEDVSDIVLYKRIEEVKKFQRKRSLEDLMYASILHRFVSLGVDLLPPLDKFVEDWGSRNYKALTEGVHSVEALELVKQHLATVLGGAPPAYGNVTMKISKLAAAQVYAASVMFGYFIRKVDLRFQLERSMGVLPRTQEETVSRLEAMFNQVEEESGEQDMDSAEGADGQRINLRQYVEKFDADTLADTARIVSAEGVTLVERQTGALFGSIETLQKEMQEAMGDDIETPNDLMKRMKEVVETDQVETLKLTYSTQRRIILEAVAFGTFLRDIETKVTNEHQLLLTPAPSTPPPPQLT